MTRLITKTLAGLALIVAAGTLQADPIDLDGFACSAGDAINGVSVDDVTGNEGGSTDCFGTFDDNDPNASGDGIETGGDVFDFLSRINIAEGDGSASLEEGSTDIGLGIFGPTDGVCNPESPTALGGATSSGCWAFDPSLFDAEEFIIVIKAANSPGWAGWLFTGDDAASSFGSWAVGWVANGTACEGHINNDESAGSGNCAQISHLTVFARGETTRVAEPATLGLLGLGLVGIGFARRRRIAA